MNDSTLLLRQIHPSFIRAGRVTSQAFRPTPKDRDRLSTDDGDRITPAAAWKRYTTVQCLQSAGVMAVTFEECRQLDLRVEADGEPYPEHVSIGFAGFGNRAREAHAKRLRSHATGRGWLAGGVAG